MKTKNFSIYLLKDGFDHTNALKENEKTGKDQLEEATAKNLPEGAKLFLLDSRPKEPWWRSYFDVEKKLEQATKGALVFLKVKDRNFAISFGHVYHHLNDYAYEYDFGLRVTLNSLDPKELKSADMVSPGTARRKRTQAAISTDLTFLDFDGNSEIIRSLTGKVKEEYRSIFKNATGSTSLKVGIKTKPNRLPEICENLLDLYSKRDYLDTFPNIQNISPVKDPTRVDELNMDLMNKFAARSDDISLSIPEIVDYHGDQTCCFFRARGTASDIFPEITIDSLWSFLDSNNLEIGDIASLRQCQLVLCDIEGTPGRAYSVMRSLVYETSLGEDDAVFHMTDGNWYRADSDFVQGMTNYINEKCEPSNLPSYNNDKTSNGKQVYSEESYNSEIQNWNENFACLDQTDISPSGYSKIEPCDVLSVSHSGTEDAIVDLYHIKISTRSSQLSHLFNQGVNSIALLKQEPECSRKLKAAILERAPHFNQDDVGAPIDQKRFSVIFGIITRKPEAGGANNLPLFSRLSLMRAMQTLDLYEVPCSLMFIEDRSPIKASHQKHHQVNVEVFHDERGKAHVRPCPGQNEFDPNQSISRCPREVREAPPVPSSDFG